MKKLLKFLGVSSAVVAVSATAAMAQTTNGVAPNQAYDICNMIAQMKYVFDVLRIMAFVGAIFCIAGWAWGYISTGKLGEGGLKEAQGKGTALIIGFILLFGTGLLISFLPTISGCQSQISQLIGPISI